MGRISIILRRPPYGTVDASEAIRHALGGMTEDLEVTMLLIDGGVHTARKGQDVSETKYLNAGDGIQDCMDMGVAVYADEASLQREQIGKENIIEGVTVASGLEIAAMIGKTDTTLVF
jgi:sulfur relay (sulfurtransferase) DsrF/TusC family protein